MFKETDVDKCYHYTDFIITVSLKKVQFWNSCHGEDFHITGPLCGEYTYHQWIPHTKDSNMDFGGFFFILALCVFYIFIPHD